MDTSSDSFDVAVVGAGIVGSSIALELGRRGVRVALIDKAQKPGLESSAAAGGVLAPHAEIDLSGPLFRLKRRGLEMFPEFVAAIREETGIDAELKRDGVLSVAIDEKGEAENRARERLLEPLGLPFTRLSAAEVREREPSLAPTVRSALFFPGEAQVESARLSEAVAVAARKRGVALRLGNPVVAVLRDGNRVAGVQTAVCRIAARTVVLAAGAWSGTVAGVPFDVPVKPARGQIVVLRCPSPPLSSMVYSGEVYLVCRNDGRVLIGATVEDVGFDKSVTAGAVQWLLASAIAVAPSLGDRPIETSWAGLRPECADHLPLIGPAPGLDGLVLATGHFRAGIILAPPTAQAIAALITGGRMPDGFEAVLPSRYAKV